MLSPFLLGGAIAFVLNVPMRAIERRLFPAPRGRSRAAGARRPAALLVTLVAVIGVLTLAAFVIGPGIAEAVSSIAAQVPGAMDRLWQQVKELERYLPQLEEALSGWKMEDWKSITQQAVELAQSWGSGLVSSGGVVIGGVVSGVSTFVIGLIFSFYILLQKEKLARQGGRCSMPCCRSGAPTGAWACCAWRAERFPASFPVSAWRPASWARFLWWP